MNTAVETNKAMTEDLKKALPVCKTITLSDGRQVPLRRFRTRQYGELMQSLMNIMSYTGVSIKLEQLPSIFTICYEDVTRLIAASSSMTVDEIDELDFDDAMLLGSEVYHLNANFFSERIKPALEKMLGETYHQLTQMVTMRIGEAKKAVSSTGEDELISLSAEDTTTKTS